MRQRTREMVVLLFDILLDSPVHVPVWTLGPHINDCTLQRQFV